MNDDEDIDGEGEVIDLDSRRTPPPPPPTRGKVGVFLHPDLKGPTTKPKPKLTITKDGVLLVQEPPKPEPDPEPEPHPYAGRTPTERAKPTQGYPSQRQAATAAKARREREERLALDEAGYEATVDEALRLYYTKMAAEEGVQACLQTPEDTLQAVAALRYRWIARVYRLSSLDLRAYYWSEGAIRDTDALKVIGLLNAIGITIPRKAFPRVHKSDVFDQIPPHLLRQLAPYWSAARPKVVKPKVEPQPPTRSRRARRV